MTNRHSLREPHAQNSFLSGLRQPAVRERKKPPNAATEPGPPNRGPGASRGAHGAAGTRTQARQTGRRRDGLSLATCSFQRPIQRSTPKEFLSSGEEDIFQVI
ncbi:uncharacterized protein LOC143661513 [Tamandua tetradactyla]|uniref:uncharacterized protein LOC143661513 n=1 Tax=Tamandua tetradactyla TaxID=48850 RepID=UPI004053BFD0